MAGPARPPLGRKIEQLRKRRSLTQTEAAKAIGVSFRQYSRWINGHQEPGAQSLRKIATAFDVTPDELLVYRSRNGGKTATQDPLQTLEEKLNTIIGRMDLLLDHFKIVPAGELPAPPDELADTLEEEKRAPKTSPRRRRRPSA